MARWLLVALLLAAGTYGWMRSAARRAHGSHEVVAVNRSGRTLERLRLSVGGESVTLDSLAVGARERVPFHCSHDGTFDVAWRVRGDDEPRHWRGGRYTNGPLPLRYRFEFTRGDGVIAITDRLPADAPAKRSPAPRGKRPRAASHASGSRGTLAHGR